MLDGHATPSPSDPNKRLEMLLNSDPQLLAIGASVCPEFLQSFLLHLSEVVECTATAEICTRPLVPLCAPLHATPSTAQTGAENETTAPTSSNYSKEKSSTLTRSEVISHFSTLFTHAGDDVQEVILSFVSQKALGRMNLSHSCSSPLPIWNEIMLKLQNQ